MAGIKTVAPDRLVHSLHGYFLRPGDPFVPAIIRVERTRDGGTFSARRILVTQRGEAIFNMDASFQVPEVWVKSSDDDAGFTATLGGENS